MQKKILGILVCILLIAPALPAVEMIEEVHREAKTLLVESLNPIEVRIVQPEGGFYINNEKVVPLPLTISIGSIEIIAEATDDASEIGKVEFYIDNELKATDTLEPYSWMWDENAFFRHTIKVKAYNFTGATAEDELSVIIFNRRASPDTPPEPYITDPYVGSFYCHTVTTPLIYGNVTRIEAVELNHAKDIASTIFEYSHNGVTWDFITVDEEEMDEWEVEWNTTGLPDGLYYIRVTMTDLAGQIRSYQKQVYYDATPPLVTIHEPASGSKISGITAFRANRTDEDIMYMDLGYLTPDLPYTFKALFNNRAKSFEQQGHGALSTNNFTFQGGFCFPVAAANALWRLAGKVPNLKKENKTTDLKAIGEAQKANPDLKKYTGKLVKNGVLELEGLAWLMAAKCQTHTIKGEDEDIIGSTDPVNVKKGLVEFLKQRGLDCSNERGYNVTWYAHRKWTFEDDNGNVVKTEEGYYEDGKCDTKISENLWDIYTSQLYKGEAIIIDYESENVGHSVCATGYNATPPKKFSYIDGHGRRHEQKWSAVKILNMWIISPKNTTLDIPDDCKGHVCLPIDRDYMDTNGAYCAYWDTTTMENGHYFVEATFVDSAGNTGRDYVLVEIDNTPEDNEPPTVVITSPENNTVTGTPEMDIIGYATDPDSGIVYMDYLWEWDGGSDSDYTTFDPPESYVDFSIELIDLSPGWNRVTVGAEDAVENYATSSVTFFYEPGGEDTTPPVTTKEVGEPNWEDGCIVTPFTPIWLNATDEGSGVDYIYCEAWWDSDGDEEVDIMMGNEITYDDTVKIYFGDYDIMEGLVELSWYAVDNAENKEETHYQEHYVMTE